jgi:hydroxymethylpyrimidine pyrophosphatase-like HAD family hydrolase
MKFLIESWRTFINEEKKPKIKIITVDFDDTIRMTDGGYPNTEVIDKIKQFKAGGVKVFIVTSRKNTSDNKLFIDDFLDENSIEHDGIFLTDTQDKWYTLGGVEESKEGKKAVVLLPGGVASDMHFDDDQHEFDAIRSHIDEFPQDKQNIKLMKVNHESGEVTEWKEGLDEVYTGKQRRWACSQIDNSSNLTKKQAKEMCKAPALKKKHKKKHKKK